MELLSWKRLDLHAKPVIFLNLNGFWERLLRPDPTTACAEGMTPPPASWMPTSASTRSKRPIIAMKTG
ncbi:MAG: hypothetical protein ACWGHP_10735 [Stenotrophomonas sp.]